MRNWSLLTFGELQGGGGGERETYEFFPRYLERVGNAQHDLQEN